MWTRCLSSQVDSGSTPRFPSCPTRFSVHSFQTQCGKNHRSSLCNKKPNQPPHCINCGKDGHPASYRGCEAAPKNRRRPRKPHPDAPEKSTLNKLVKAIVKALTIKDFFTESQLSFLAKEIEEKPDKADASTQTDSSEPPSTEAIESTQPEPMEETVSQAPPPDLEQATPPAKVIDTSPLPKIEEESTDEYMKRIYDCLEQIRQATDENS